MSSEEFRFMLWVRNSDGTWTMRSRGTGRGQIEREVTAISRKAVWRFVSRYEGLLAESVARA